MLLAEKGKVAEEASFAGQQGWIFEA